MSAEATRGPSWCSLHACTAGECAAQSHDRVTIAHLRWALEHLDVVLASAARLGVRCVPRYTNDGTVPPYDLISRVPLTAAFGTPAFPPVEEAAK